jgi:purine-binding chemotaxis protein CheW
VGDAAIDLDPDQIMPPPRIGTQIRTDFIKGMGRRDTEFIMILDIDRVFSAEELTAVRVDVPTKLSVPNKQDVAIKQLVEVAA